MIMPMFKEDYQDKSLKELLKDRQRVMKEIIRIENEDFYINPKPSNNKPPFEPKMMIDPAPEVVWAVLNKDLKMLNEIIEEHNVEKEIILEIQ